MAEWPGPEAEEDKCACATRWMNSEIEFRRFFCFVVCKLLGFAVCGTPREREKRGEVVVDEVR